MGRLRCTRVFAAVFIGVTGAGFIILAVSGAFNYEYWTRDHPLVDPIQVTLVQNGSVTLSDGRTFRPAGVVLSDGVSQNEFDSAIEAIVAQGVKVTRDFGDGRAFLVAEPKFYNWCGTRTSFGHWAGIYIQCGLSELLVQTEYADPSSTEIGLTPQDQWRLEGAVHFRNGSGPTTLGVSSLRFDGSQFILLDYEAMLEGMWKPPPAP